MRISDLISLGKEYLLLGIVLILFLFLCFLLGYFGIYRKLLKGTKTLSLRACILPAVFLCYLIVVLGATMLSRSGYWESYVSLHLFSSYREAWNRFSATEWRNIILNICMFVPFGFLLPLLSKKFQRFWSTYLAGLAFTLVIELLQILLKRGIFDTDDIIDNLAGAMIGYGFYKLLITGMDLVKKRNAPIRSALLLQLPLLIVIGVFLTIFGVYHQKELGNLSCSYNYKHDVTIVSQFTYEDETKEAAIYQFPVLSVSDTKAFAETFFARLGVGVDDSRTDIYENTAIYYSDDGNRYSLWVDYAGGTYSFTDYDALDYEKNAANTVKTEEEVRADLAALNILPPETCSFVWSDDVTCQFTLSQQTTDGVFYDGSISCTYGTDGSLSKVNDFITEYAPYKNAPILSEQQAAEQIAAGKFYYYTDDSLSVELGAVSLVYQKDTKGFYQPVYQFEAVINGQEMPIYIPALS